MRIRFLLAAVSSLALVTALPAQTPNSPLGMFEAQQDVGVNPMAGSAVFDAATGEYRVTGGGANIWAGTDAFHFVWMRVTGAGLAAGNFRFGADVRFLGQGAVAHRKVVLMVRQDLTPDSAYADVALHGDGLTALQFRPAAGAETQEIRSTVSAPTRILIERRGKSFRALAFGSGGEITATASQYVDLPEAVYIGLGVCSHDAGVLETAVFSNVKLDQGGSSMSGVMNTPQHPPAPHYRSKITIYDLATRTTRMVYQADQVIEAPNWSRDGKFLLINTEGHLYRLPLQSSGEPKLEQIDLGPGGYVCNNDHDLSRDGKWLAFSASSPSSHQSQVYLAKSDGSGVRLMTPAAPSYFHGWSPDGTWLAFVGQREGAAFHLYRVSAGGGAEQQLTSQGTYDDGTEYTPDGKWIYFNSNRSGSWHVWRMPADGAGPGDAKAEQITSDEWEDWFPHFSPDGKHMLVFSFPKGTKTHNDRMDGVVLRLMPAPGEKLEPAKPETLLRFYGGQGTINVNSWSPDSRQFAFVVYEPLPAPGTAKP